MRQEDYSQPYWFSKPSGKLKGDNPTIEERDRLNNEVASLTGGPLTPYEKLSIEKRRLYEYLKELSETNSRP